MNLQKFQITIKKKVLFSQRIINSQQYISVTISLFVCNISSILTCSYKEYIFNVVYKLLQISL